MLEDEDIQSLIDNELSWEEEKRVRAVLASDPKLQARYEELKRQKSMLNAWYRNMDLLLH